MSEILNVENGAVYEGYDSATAGQWCSPSFLGCSVCAAASAVEGQVTLSLSLNTPFGNVTKSFTFNTNTSFTWQPFSKFKVTLSIANFNEASGVFSFDLGLKPCVDVPFFGWKCFDYSHHFSVPLFLAGIHNNIADSEFSSLLALHASGLMKNDCKCDDQNGGHPFQGEIYSNYLNAQSNAAFPTFPLNQCIPTGQCIPTVTSCITGISPICAAQQGAQQGGGLHANAPAAAFPTFPLNQCIPTGQCFPTVTSCITGISPICSAQQGAQQGGGLHANAPAAAFPTFPLNQCIPTGQCIPTVTSCITGISPICAAQLGAQQGGGLHANAPAAAFPTFPLNQCIPTGQCIPTVTSCITGISPICAAQQGGGLQAHAAEAFPTLPVNQCFPTGQCFPTLTTCITGLSPFCAAQQHAGGLQANAPAQSAQALPTLPVASCVPTVQCIPTLSCIPTASCTGIPFIC